MPYIDGRRVSQAWWAANRPDAPTTTVKDAETGQVILDHAPFVGAVVDEAGDPVTLGDALQPGRGPMSRAKALAAIADAVGEPVSVTWPLDDLPDEPERPTAPRLAPDESPEPVGRVHNAQAEAFAKARGFVSNPNRPSEQSEGRRRRHIKAKARRLGISIKAAEQLTPRRTPKEPS